MCCSSLITLGNVTIFTSKHRLHCKTCQVEKNWQMISFQNVFFLVFGVILYSIYFWVISYSMIIAALKQTSKTCSSDLESEVSSDQQTKLNIHHIYCLYMGKVTVILWSEVPWTGIIDKSKLKTPTLPPNFGSHALLILDEECSHLQIIYLFYFPLKWF